MNISKSTSYVLLHVLNGCATTAEVGEHLESVDVRSIQRALARLTDLGLLTKNGASNNPSYAVDYAVLQDVEIVDKLLEDENRPASTLRHEFIAWLASLSVTQMDDIFGKDAVKLIHDNEKMSAKDLEHLTIELSWKSSSLEGNTYTLLDTQLLLVEGIKAKNKTDFETQMILNHKNAIAFIIENPELFSNDVLFSTVEELHRIIGNNLGIEAGIRKKLVRISASNYVPLANPYQLKEAMQTVLAVIGRSKSPFVRALLALSLVPYLQAFEDGNKRTGRMLANAILISTVHRGFSLRKAEARRLALAYLSFYEFNSMHALSKILKSELTSE
jgi:predicted transcriptional regulator